MHLYISTVRSTLYVTLFSTVVVNNDDAMEAENLENEYRNSAFALYSTTSNSLPKHDSNHRAEGNENCLFQDLNSPDRLFFPGIFPTQHPSFFQSIESVLNPPPPYPTRSQLPPPPYPTRSQLPPDTLPQSEVPAATLPTGAIPNITEGPGGLTLPSGFSTETAPLPPLQLFSSRWRQSAPPNIDIPKFPISEINTVQSSINTASADTVPFLGEPLGSFAQTQTTDSAVFKVPQSKDRTTVKRPSTGTRSTNVSEKILQKAKWPHKCSICFKRFAFISGLEKHTEICRMSYECSMCQMKVDKLSHLRQHVVRNHSASIFCPKCVKFFKDEAEFKDHNQKKHNGRTHFACYLCVSIFSTEDGAAVHFAKFHLAIGPPFKCDLCDIVCTDSKSFWKHMITHNKPPVYSCQNCPNTKLANEKAKRLHKCTGWPKNQVRCQFCGEVFDNRTKEDTHVCLDPITKSIHYRCSVCKVVFQNKLTFNQHYLIKHTKRTRKSVPVCSRCLLVFNTVEQRNAHRCHEPSAYPVNKSKLECPVCLKAVSPINLAFYYHMLEEHSWKEPYRCQKCNTKFKRKTCFISHVRYDAVCRNPYTCKICGTGLLTESILQNHIMLFHYPYHTNQPSTSDSSQT